MPLSRALILSLVTLLFVSCANAAASEPTRFIRIGTGGIGGTYFPVGGLIAHAISSPPGDARCDLGGSCGVEGVIAAAVSTQGSVENAQLVSRQKLDLGLCQADIAYDISLATGAFAGKPPLSNLRAIGNLFAEQLHVVVRRDGKINSLKELKGHRVSLGEPGSGTRITTSALFAAIGLPPQQVDIVLEPVDTAGDGLVANRISAFAIVGGYPIAAIRHAAEQAPITLLPVSGKEVAAFRRQDHFYIATVIPAGTYEDVGETPTLAVAALLIVAAEMDDDLVFNITRALWDPRNAKMLQAGAGERRFRLSRGLDGVSIPLHPGAARYYGSIGFRLAGEL
jgi:TRAP transporter TAXI family solute receptor